MPSKVGNAVKKIADTAKAKVDEAKARIDGWANIMTGLGILGRDKRMSASLDYSPMADEEAEVLYSGSDVAAEIVEALPEDALRQWIKYETDIDGLAAKVDKAVDDLKFAERLYEAMVWGRVYGGAALLISVDDGLTLDKPLDLTRVRAFKSLNVLVKRELIPESFETDLDSTRFGEPVLYRYSPNRADSNHFFELIHHSRLIIFYGVKLPLRQKIRNNYWGDSVLNRAQNAIRNYDTSNDAAATILQEFNIGVHKMKGLAALLQAGQDQAVINRLSIVATSKSVCRSVAIDSEDEEFQNMGASVHGIPDMLDRMEKRLVTAARMPHTRLLGQSPSGLGATGNSENNNWNKRVMNTQEIVIRPALDILFSVMFSARKGPTGGKIPENWKYEFNPLEQPNETEIMKNRELQAKIDDIYVNMNIVDSQEIRKSRFGSGRYSHETVIEGEVLPEKQDPKEPDDKDDE